MSKDLGSAKHGAKDWWLMKVTSLALIPLGLWLAYSLMTIGGLEQSQVQLWLKNPIHATVLGLFMLVGLHHSAHGVQVVMEDYISTPSVRNIALIANTLAHLAAAGFGLCAIIASAFKS